VNIVIMYVVATIFTVIGGGMLLAITGKASEQRIYAFRMIGTMALALGVVLIMSATALWHWSATT
jgi:hypothetical protein